MSKCTITTRCFIHVHREEEVLIKTQRTASRPFSSKLCRFFYLIPSVWTPKETHPRIQSGEDK